MWQLPDNAKIQTDQGWQEATEVDSPCSVRIGEFKYGPEIFNDPKTALDHGIKPILETLVDTRYFRKIGETRIDRCDHVELRVEIEPKFTPEQLGHRRIQELNMVFEKMKDKAKADIEGLMRSGDYQSIIDYRWENQNV